MKRFIDLREQSTNYRFAWFDTVTDTFEDHNGQTWDTWSEFEEDYDGDDLERYKNLCPDWAYEPDLD